jgi:thiol-disulfide isomerase/thioredoxin
MHTDDGNRGRVDVMVATGVSRGLGGGSSVDLGLKLPVVTHVVGGQLDMPAIAEVGVSWTLGKATAEGEGEAGHHHDHDHEHGDGDEHGHGDEHGGGGGAESFVHPDTTGLDVLDVGKPGEAVALVPVPGKVTIFDFWATWCEPCKELEPALVEIARRNPDKVAIRRIDALDWDSEAVATYLTPGRFNLPHVKVLDVHGKLVLEKGAEPGKLDELIEAVRRTVESGPAPQPQPPVVKPVVKPVTVKVAVTEKGFEPGDVTVPRGRPVTLVFERKTAKTCATEVIFVADGKRIEQALPLDKPVAIKLTFKAAGTIKYACGMDMIRGTITVR